MKKLLLLLLLCPSLVDAQPKKRETAARKYINSASTIRADLYDKLFWIKIMTEEEKGSDGKYRGSYSPNGWRNVPMPDWYSPTKVNMNNWNWAIMDVRRTARKYRQLDKVPIELGFADDMLMQTSDEVDTYLNNLKSWVYSRDDMALFRANLSLDSAKSSQSEAFQEIQNYVSRKQVSKRYVR